jgi:pilus assembly protein CpaE
LARHAPTDLFALCAPEDPGAGERITGAMVGTIIEALAKEFRYQVIDTSAGLEEHTLVALDRATDVVIVVDLDVPSVRGARKLMEALDVIGLHHAQRYLVLNRADSKVGLKLDEVVAALNVPIDVTLPSSRAVPLSYNEGRPLVISHPRHPFSRGIRSLAERIVQAPVRSRRQP